MFKDIAKVEKDFKVALLRYCNPVAAHPSGKFGEDPFLKPTILIYEMITMKNFLFYCIFYKYGLDI